ncbi:cysteine-rich motor neuron 1 protein [Chelonus insularis]|uniref:cysteine-rich motor neuron 1 protein n=1 Tax=Chelonus insularis TaxID=460826 RepID=UPI00158E7517|nr:cysteine-rich motor neuron 1 protein-like [Chelonus insularis]
MKAPFILFGGIIVLSLAVARALSCVCSPLECDILTEEDCPGGLTWDPCKCCKVCARVEGEPCGGLFGFSGRCAVGLQCVIKNLRPPEELDEGICSKIPGRWRRHCPHGPKMSGSGCNLIEDGISNESSSSGNAGRCVCGPSVPWCPDEPHPYVFPTRHECRLNLAAKIAYDDVVNAPDQQSFPEAQSLTCPEDSIATEDGCKCVSPCPPVKCLEGQRPEVRSAAEETPGSCCPLYHCVPQTPISWAAKDEGEFKGCIDESGSPRAIGEQWNQEPCTNCTCEESNGIGTRSCHTTMCKSCEGSSQLITGECCPRCLDSNNETETFTTIANMPTENCDSLVNCEPPCHLGTLDDLDSCPSCECPNDAESTMNSTNKMCPKLVHCGLDCKLERDQGDCPVCACQSNPEHNVTVIPVNGPGTSDEQEERSVICPELKCDLHCDHGFVMDENDCTLCECKPQALDCPPLGCKKKCPYGYKHNRRGCPTCRCHATCVDHRNITHPEGSSWNPDACTSCKCDALGRLVCRETVCSVACSNPLPPKQGTCCPVCPINETDNSKNENHQSNRSGWGIVPITLIVVLTLLCLILMIFLARGRFRGRLSPSSNLYTSYPAQYYKCVPAYETPVHQNEKIVPL